ncbi:MAG: hypothetical protein K9G44_04465 [Melioribacteraceae bacterium]|nr:hypothetical protein [Melioribacteraceae bacterium]
MKKPFLFALTLILFISCSSEPEKMELKSPNGFAFPLEDTWEFNGNVQVYGFSLLEDEDDIYHAAVKYKADLAMDGTTIFENVDSGKIEKSSEEEIAEMEIEFQIEFGSNFDPGNYELIIIAEDLNSTKKDTCNLPFELSEF